jgi:serine/threonine protein kinase
MAPEVLRGEEYSYECDFWSLGVLLFELIEGIPPFGYDRKAVMLNILNSPESVRFSDQQSAESRELISRLLQPDRNDRITSFDEIRSCAFFAGKSKSWWEQARWDASGDNDTQVPDYDEWIAESYIFGRKAISRTMDADDVFCDF